MGLKCSSLSVKGDRCRWIHSHLCMCEPSVSRTADWLSSASKECWSRASDSWHSEVRTDIENHISSEICQQFSMMSLQTSCESWQDFDQLLLGAQTKACLSYFCELLGIKTFKSRSYISRWKPVNESLAEFKEETEYLQVWMSGVMNGDASARQHFISLNVFTYWWSPQREDVSQINYQQTEHGSLLCLII